MSLVTFLDSRYSMGRHPRGSTGRGARRVRTQGWQGVGTGRVSTVWYRVVQGLVLYTSLAWPLHTSLAWPLYTSQPVLACLSWP